MEATLVDNVELIRGGYDAFGRGDVPGVLARFAPEIEWTIPGPRQLAGTYVGHEGVGRFFERISQAYDLHVRAEEIVPLADDRVLALGTHVVDGAAGPEEIGFAHLWTVRDGKATSFLEFTDTERFAAQVRA